METEIIAVSPETDSSDDLRSQLQAAYEESTKAETDESASSRTRDDKGRFSKAEAGAEGSADTHSTASGNGIEDAAANPGTVVASDPPQAATANPDGTATDVVKAPESWSPVAKANFAELPADIQAEISKREADIHKGMTRQDEERSFGRQLKEVINPYLPLIQAEGGNPVAAVQSLLNSAYVLRVGSPEQKLQLFQQLAQQYGVPVDRMTQSSDPFVDPQVQALQQRLQALESQRQQELYQQQSQQYAQVQSAIDAFAADPKNAHYEAVKAEMAALLQAGRAKDLQEAYDMAVWARPDIRSSLLQQQQQEAEAKRVAEAKAKADAAKRAGASVSGSPGVSAPPDLSALSLRDQLKAAMQTAGRI